MVRRWTQEEYDYLEDRWGVVSIKQIAANLGRTVSAVKAKAGIMGLGDPRLNIDGITINALSKAFKIGYPMITKHWIPEHGFPVKSKIVSVNDRVKYVEYKAFWKWAEKNKKLINFARLEENILGEEPRWVKEARRLDFNNIEKRYRTPWTDEEINKLIDLVKLQKYTAFEISSMIGRSERAIQRKLWEWDIKDRPVESISKPWLECEIKTVIELKKKGYGNNSIAQELGRTSGSILSILSRVSKEVAI